MNKVRLLFTFLALTISFHFATAQIYLKVEPIAGTADTYGVYVRVCENITPSANTITGSGQVTIKFPSGRTFSGLTSVAGTWAQNAMVASPNEAPGKVYVSMGFLQDNPHILYAPDSESLLFTFKLTGPDNGPIEIISNSIDPFDHLPNSVSSNPGNELTVLDFGVQPLGLYTYKGNYIGASCANTPPQDTTTIINPPGDTSNQDTTIINPPGDTSNQDTTIINPPGDTSNQDTTIINPPGDTSNQDTTIINPPGDTTQQTSSVHNLQNETGQFTLYPTPAFEWVTVKFQDQAPENGVIKLFTLNGVSLGEIKRGQRPDVTLNVSGLTSGLYLIRYDKDGKTLQQTKFLKQ